MWSKQPPKLAMLIQLILLVLFYGPGNVHCSTVHENRIDLQSLLDFKNGIIEDPTRALANWNTNTHFCRWNGVRCTTTRPFRVLMLNLTAQNLAGKITSSLANLSSLSFLDLSSNRLFGQLPLLNNLQKLDTLNISINTLEGTIPDELMNCSNLRKVDISGNSLHGEIPPNIGVLTNLEHLDLSSNNLTGTIPASVQNLTKLNLIRLKENYLDGSIPERIWQLPNLDTLILGNNVLSGEIPHNVNFSRIEVLSLELNTLGKVLPLNFGDAFHQLQQVTLGQNNFEGQIPPSLGNASALRLIDFSRNSFTGKIPTSFGRLSKLSTVNLEQNKLEANENQWFEFLHALTNCTSLTVLSVAVNNLQGTLPDSIGNLSINLQVLLLRANNFSGIVPPSIGNFSNLTTLSLGQNSFSGEIGEWIGNLKNLQGLSLHENNLAGPINPSIGNLTQLSRLYLQSNKFEGIIPPSIGLLSQLSDLNLSYNNLQGSIPAEVGNLQSLSKLDFTSNKLTGEIPDTLGQCDNLENIGMGKNLLTGTIPISLKNIKSLVSLNLSHNNLSGNILSMQYMLALSVLDLSYNDLQGEIPRNGVFKNATAVSLGGNGGLCGGAMNLHMPPCPTVSQRSERRPNLIKILIPIFGFLSLALLVYFLFLPKRMPRRTHLPLTDVGENFPKVSYADLAQATKNFSASELIGKGSYGSVYRGKLKETKTDVAVKVFNLEMRGAERSFLSECEALRSIQHRNLLPIITACSTVDNEGNVFKALVYEFMPNGSLDRWLHEGGDGKLSKRLAVTHRINIAVNIADALDYLHHDCGRPTVHCDLKPSNILLDDDMTALLGDFGIARFYADPSLATVGCNSSIGVKGTIGYIAPEYAGGGRASTSGDVYSFGIVLLEMMTGKRPTDSMFKDGLDIVTFVSNNVPHQIHHVIDAHLMEQCKDSAEGKTTVSEQVVFQSVVSLLEVALSCTSPLPSGRLNMKQIASKMHAIKTSYLAGFDAKK